jgi:ubiquinone/menaquinone biosynthesis C-methylase UbiE
MPGNSCGAEPTRDGRPRTGFGASAREEGPDLAAIADAFTKTAARYDAFAHDHPHLTRMRAKVYAAFERFVAPDGSVLELNAGTGTDALQLAQRGHRVHATDIAPGMLARLRDKVATHGLEGRVSVQECSFLSLDEVLGGPFDAVFSDLGGLNCCADLRPVFRGVDRLLRPGGVAVVVVMPPICLWELALVFTGQFRLATRRLTAGGGRAHLEGREFDVHYFTPRQVLDAFGPGYEPLGVEGISVLTPTAESKGLAHRHPRLYRLLAAADDFVSPHAPFSRWGDFFLVAVRRRVPSVHEGRAR